MTIEARAHRTRFMTDVANLTRERGRGKRHSAWAAHTFAREIDLQTEGRAGADRHPAREGQIVGMAQQHVVRSRRERDAGERRLPDGASVHTHVRPGGDEDEERPVRLECRATLSGPQRARMSASGSGLVSRPVSARVRRAPKKWAGSGGAGRSLGAHDGSRRRRWRPRRQGDLGCRREAWPQSEVSLRTVEGVRGSA